MKRTVLIMVLVLVVGLIGGGVWLSQRDNDANRATTNETPSTQNTQNNNDGRTFQPLTTTDVSYEALLTAQRDGQPYEATLRFDGKGNAELLNTQNNQRIRMVVTKDAFYSCQNETCYKIGEGLENFDPASYGFSQQEITNLQRNAVYKGTEACGSATCDVWQITHDSSEGLVYVDQATKRIMRATGMYDGNQGELVFTYKPVTIEIPTDAQTLGQ